MKKLLTVTAVLAVLFIALSVVTAGAGEEYLISKEGDAYILSRYESGEPTRLFASDSLFGILTELSGLGGTPRAVLDAIEASGDTALPVGKYILSGSLTVTGTLSVPEGCEVYFSSLNLNISGGNLAIKGGTLGVENSRIFSDADTAVLLDYSSRSALDFRSGEISGSYSVAAIAARSGSLIVSGGKITNLGGAAILADTVISLSGSPEISGAAYGIRSSRPMSLSSGSAGFSGSVTVAFDKRFTEGTITELFYNASAEAVEGIVVLDADLCELPLTFFEASRHTSEKNFAAVYLPYSLKYFSGDELILEEKYISGEMPTLISPPERLGYSALGWYLQSGEAYIPSGISSDVSLFCRYSLESPTFSVSSLAFTYDGSSHALAFERISHPLIDLGAYLIYEWKRDGVTVGTAPTLSLTEVSDSGEYSVTVTLYASGDSVSFSVDNISVKITPATVKIPKITPATYTGARIYPTVAPSSLYTVSEVFGIGAGSYPVALTLTDPENYRWDGIDGATAYTDFVIEPAKNLWVEEPRVSGTFEGIAPKIYGKALFGEVTVSYSDSELGPYTDTVPTLPGEYFARLTVAPSADFFAITSLPIPFVISEDAVVAVRVESYAVRSEYYAFEHFSPDGLSLIATYKSGREAKISADKIKISYNGADTLRVGDRSVTLSFGGSFTSHPITVLPIRYDLSGISLSDTELVYDGKYHTANAALPEIVGLDGIPLRYTVTGGGTDAGSYGVTLAFSTDSQNYITPDPLFATVRISPLAVTLLWTNTDFTYDGTAKLPSAAYTDVYGVKRYPKVTGERFSAGENYTATAIPDTENYFFQNPEYRFNIKKADYDLSGVYWSDSSFVYNGERRSTELLGLPDGVTVVGYTDAQKTGAGIYTAYATLSYDTENYNAPPPLSHRWVIYPAEYDITGFYFPDTEAVYDGNIHYPTLVGELPTGLDGITLSYSFSVGARHVSEGRVPVTVTFISDSENYVAPSPKTVYVTVFPRGISVNWQSGELVYNGKQKAPTAYSPECAVKVFGAASDAGTYTARAESLDPDYYIINNEYEYEIKRAENLWLTEPSVSDIYEGDTLLAAGKAHSGEVEYKFFLDENMENEIPSPTASGKYYAVAYVPETKNYLEIKSAPIPFEIIEVVPTELSVRLSGAPLYALSPVTSDSISAYIIYNNGERRQLDLTELSVAYESGEVLHFGDREILVSYLGFTERVSIDVSRIDYDLSGVAWVGTDTVYDGEMKCPTLTGLPAGVSVIGYEGYGSLAGEYTVRAILSYDSQNYNSPKISDAHLVIRRAVVTPSLPSAVYDGAPHIPSSDSPLYSVVAPVGVVAAGSYPVTLRLTDSENYTFPEGDEATVIFTVLPHTLTLELSDRLLYLFESPADTVITSPEGTLPGDTVEIIGKIEGERVIYTVNNPNYTLSVGEGKVIRVPYPSPDFTWAMLFVILSLLLVILAVLVFFYRRENILAALAAARCRRRMARVLSAPAPKTVAPAEKISQGDASLALDAERADGLISDSLAKSLIKRSPEPVVTTGNKRGTIGVDTLSESFPVGCEVDINILKEKNLIPYDTAYLKVLAHGAIDKALTVKANDFSLAAVKMIALSGGEAVKVVTVRQERIIRPRSKA